MLATSRERTMESEKCTCIAYVRLLAILERGGRDGKKNGTENLINVNVDKKKKKRECLFKEKSGYEYFCILGSFSFL